MIPHTPGRLHRRLPDHSRRCGFCRIAGFRISRFAATKLYRRAVSKNGAEDKKKGISMSTSSARHEAPRNGWPVKRRLIRVLAGSAVVGAMAVGGLQFALGTATRSATCATCARPTTIRSPAVPVAVRPTIPTPEAASTSQRRRPRSTATARTTRRSTPRRRSRRRPPPPRSRATRSNRPRPRRSSPRARRPPRRRSLHGQHHRATVAARAVDRHTVRPEHDGQHSRDHRRHGRERRCHRHSDLEGRGLPEEQR
mgnify:CR=1 FL=1